MTKAFSEGQVRGAHLVVRHNFINAASIARLGVVYCN